MRKRQVEQQERKRLLAEEQRIEKLIKSAILELTNEDIELSMREESYNTKLLNDKIIFEFAINILGYAKEDALSEIHTSDNGRYILEILRSFMWVGDISQNIMPFK